MKRPEEPKPRFRIIFLVTALFISGLPLFGRYMINSMLQVEESSAFLIDGSLFLITNSLIASMFAQFFYLYNSQIKIPHALNRQVKGIYNVLLPLILITSVGYVANEFVPEEELSIFNAGINILVFGATLYLLYAYNYIINSISRTSVAVETADYVIKRITRKTKAKGKRKI